MYGGRKKITLQTDGFTLLEVLLSLALIALVALLPFLLGNFSLSRGNLAHVTLLTVESLRNAKHFAVAEKSGESWGVKISPAHLTIFKGASYLSRDTAHDRVLEFPQEITASGLDEILFEHFSGRPMPLGTIILSEGEESSSIIMREHGFIDY